MNRDDAVLSGKVALVTGAGGGLGSAFCRQLAREGADVALVDVAEGAASETAEAIRAMGRRVLVCMADIADWDQVRSVVEQTVEELGSLDILVNNAGGSLHTPKHLEEIEPEHFDLVINVNLRGTFLCCKAAVPHMRARGGGRIVNVSSIGGRTASVVTGVPYAAAKAGVVGLTRRLAREVGPWGITVNALAPGAVLSGPRLEKLWAELDDAEQGRVISEIPLGRLGTIEEQADALMFLASPASRYMTGAVLDVNGGRFMG